MSAGSECFIIIESSWQTISASSFNGQRRSIDIVDRRFACVYKFRDRTLSSSHFPARARLSLFRSCAADTMPPRSSSSRKRLVSFSADNTICLRRSASSSTLCPTLPSSPASSPTLSPLPTSTPQSQPHSPSAAKKKHSKPKAKKARSPVKGLFAFSPSPPTPAATNGVIRVPCPPLAAVDKNGDAWVDEEGWVDDDCAEDAFGADTEVEGDDRELELQDREGDEDEDDEGDNTFDESALPTPVPHAWCFVDAIPIEVERPYATPDTPRESGYSISFPYPASPVTSPTPASLYATTAPAPLSPYPADAPTTVSGKRKR
ncbi:hypothetical protein DFH09DRAFT_1324871 [Mycena vulgaris]|nr:hypothetical protein DFH09DRAFT_1324871 [Mycena vulgaris]